MIVRIKSIGGAPTACAPFPKSFAGDAEPVGSRVDRRGEPVFGGSQARPAGTGKSEEDGGPQPELVVGEGESGIGWLQALALDEALQFAEGPLAHMMRVGGRTAVEPAAVHEVAFRGGEQGKRGVVEEAAQKLEQGDGVDEMLDDIGTDDDAVAQDGGRQVKVPGGFEVGFDPLAEGMSGAAIFEVGTHVHADDLKLGMKRGEFVRRAAADVQQLASAQMAGGAGGDFVHLRLPDDAIRTGGGVVVVVFRCRARAVARFDAKIFSHFLMSFDG